MIGDVTQRQKPDPFVPLDIVPKQIRLIAIFRAAQVAVPSAGIGSLLIHPVQPPTGFENTAGVVENARGHARAK